MPVTQIAIVPNTLSAVAMETMGGLDGDVDSVTPRGHLSGDIVKKGSDVNCGTEDSDLSSACPSAGEGHEFPAPLEGPRPVLVAWGQDSSPHIEAKTVILQDTNSDFMSDDISTPSDLSVALEHSGTPAESEQSPSSDTKNTSNTAAAVVVAADKNTNSRRSGKKKGKPMSIRKKDTETQETLHPNSPTPMPTERCDSSLSNMDACRICQCDSCEILKDSPLVAPCLCSGSLKFVHQACLQKWIKSSDKLSCELCHFEYQMTKKTKPFREWEKLEMTPQERRKVVCSVTFHVIAITCVVWSLYVLIDRTTEEVEAGSLLWPFWTKLIVVAIGFTGGVVFMYVQCKMYLSLCKKWRMYNKVILISSVSEGHRWRTNHEGVLKIHQKQAIMEEGRQTNFDVFTIVQETENV